MKKVVALSIFGGLLVVALVFAALMAGAGMALAQGATATATMTSPVSPISPISPMPSPTVVSPLPTATVGGVSATAVSPVTGVTSTPSGLPRTGGENMPVGWLVLAGLGVLVALTGFAMRKRLA